MDKITGLILAGGRGSRMGSVDKGLQAFRGRPMIAHVLERFAPQVDEILINANRSLDEYAAFGHRVVPDAIDGFAGPLAGLHIGMAHATHPLVATVPCDSPFLQADLIARLSTAMQQHGADLAVAKTFDQPHPVFCLTRASLAPHIQAYQASGQRQNDKCYATHKVVEVPFDDQEAAFSNINTVEELKSLEQQP